MARLAGAWAIDKRTGERVQSGTVQGALDTANAMNQRYRPQLPGATGGVSNVAKPVSFGGGYQGGPVAGFGTVGAIGAGRGPVQSARDANGFLTPEALQAGAASRNQGTAPTGAQQVATLRNQGMAENARANGYKGELNLPGVTQPQVLGLTGTSNIKNTVTNAVTKNISAPGIDPATVQGMKSRARDSVARGAVGQRAAATNALRAAGFGNSGDAVGSMVDINTRAAGEANRLSRDIELDAANRNAGYQQAAIGQGIQLAGMEQSAALAAQDRADQLQRYKDQQAERAMVAGMPEFTMDGFSFGGRGTPVGGGANAQDTQYGPWTRNQFRGWMTAAGFAV